ncbi:HAD family phosphatase [uncultured Thalassospira sp.]|jgi:HAD superfamily hydrolase (TIGR01509 family)|uniref:HAD family hydrolase n=1 Tax=uncultured Thalassospira sp. TaxID=404382 RepID=UPI0030DBC2D1|tara:strand:- start:7367 stop:8086 length:720 start_codon:yes stop_codon:yes gene_type:complete
MQTKPVASALRIEWPAAIKAVLFDCDGVLVNSEPISLSTLVDVLAHFGAPLSLEDVARRFTGRSSAAPIDHIRAETGRDVSADFKPYFYDRLFVRYETELHKISNIDDVLVVLKQRDIPFCISSSSSVRRLETTMRITGLGHWFDGHIYSADFVKKGKPAPDLFLYAAGDMGFDPSMCLVVEDSVAGVQAAIAAGMMCWGFVGGGHYDGARNDAQQRLIDAGAHQVFDNMADLAAVMTC